MHPILRKLVYLALIFFVIFAGIQPYNRYCNNSSKCEGIYFSDLFPGPKGTTQISAIMEIKNYRSDFILEAIDPKIIYTVGGEKNTANYRMQNISDKTLYVRPEFYVEPKEFEKYVIRRECLCSREYKLDKGDVLFAQSIFKIDSAIEKDPAFKKDAPQIRIGYIVKPAN